MTPQEIIDALSREENFDDDYNAGWNAGVRDGATGAEPYEDNEDPDGYVDGFFNEEVEWFGPWELAYNDGKREAIEMMEGKSEMQLKTPEDLAAERRQKCFTIAEKYQQNGVIRGGEREPIGETIARAQVLYDFFWSGAKLAPQTGE